MFAQLETIDVFGTSDEQSQHFIHAHVASLADGVVAEHIDKEALTSLEADLRQRLVAHGFLDNAGSRTAKRLHSQHLWSFFVDALRATGRLAHSSLGKDLALSDTRDPNATYGTGLALSLARLEFQGEAIREGAKQLGYRDLVAIEPSEIADLADSRDQLARVVECLNAALARGLVPKTNPFKFSLGSVTWIAPLVEPGVRKLHEERDTEGIVQAACCALRDLLGLWEEDGNSDRPLAAFSIRCQATLSAPNVITAGGYHRFRHRPAALQPDAPDAGLTYNLNERDRPSQPGSCEVVTNGMTLGHIEDVIMCGQPSPITTEPAELLELHRVYAAEAMNGRTWRELLHLLENEL